MISVSTAVDSVLAAARSQRPRLKARSHAPAAAQSELLMADLVADRSYPPFHRVAMDGIAIRHECWLAGQRQFPISGLQRAGDPIRSLQDPHHCLEVMTGAALPEGCDCVIRYEDIQINDGQAAPNPDLDITPWQNVHRQASDYRQGQQLVKSPFRLGPAEWAIAASVGQAAVQVQSRPKISIFSTGDELVPIEQTPQAHQIRQSNAYAIISSLREQGFFDLKQRHLADDRSALSEALSESLEQAEVIILSGGVSKGKFDYVPECLRDLQVHQHFHKVAQRPGKPLWFGQSQQGGLVFGLPGNPVSTLICLHRYVLPALWSMMGVEEAGSSLWAQLTEDIEFDKPLCYFPIVAVRCTARGELQAKPLKSNGSGDFAALHGSHGFLQLDAQRHHFAKGEALPLYLWKGAFPA